VAGLGCLLFDDKGREYLDMLGGIAVNALGHAHPGIVAALREAVSAETPLLHCSNLHHHPYQGPLAARLAWLLRPGAGLLLQQRIRGGRGGAEARARPRLRLKGEKATGIVALEGSFHGRTALALSATGQEKYRARSALSSPA